MIFDPLSEETLNSRNVNKDLFDDDGLVLQHRLMGTDLASQGLSDDEKDSDPDKDSDDLRTNSQGQIVTADITEWQEFWITIETGNLEGDDGALTGTHFVNVYHAEQNSAFVPDPHPFYVTASTGEDFPDDAEEQSYIAIGAGATGAEGAFDIDFFSWSPGIHEPRPSLPNECGLGQILMGDLNEDGEVGFVDFLVLSGNFGESAHSFQQGDINCDGTVGFADFLVLSANFGKTLEVASQSVPEPATIAWFLPGLLVMLNRPSRHGGAIAPIARRNENS